MSILNKIPRISFTKHQQYFYGTVFFIIAAFVLYGNTLEGEFIGGDDISLIVRNDVVHDVSPAGLRRIFCSPFFQFSTFAWKGQTLRTGGYYRPLSVVSYWADYALWQLAPFGYHLTNIGLHILSVILLFFFLDRATKKTSFSFVVATVFLIHPLHTLHVGPLGGRTDLVCIVFFFCTLLCYSYYRAAGDPVRKNLYISGALLSFFAALLAKEAALTLPFIIILYDMCFSDKRPQSFWRERFGTYGTFFMVLVLFLCVRSSIVGPAVRFYWNVTFNQTFFLRMLTGVSILISQLKTMLVPYPLYYYWRYVPLVSTYGGGVLWKFCIFCFTTGAITFISWRRSKVIFFGIGFFFITYFPVSNIIPIWTGMAHHSLFVGRQFLHIPLTGFLIACVALLFQCGAIAGPVAVKKVIQRVFVWFFIIVVFLFSVLTIYHNITWTNTWYYATRVLRQIPESVDMRAILGLEYMQAAKYAEAEYMFTEAIDVQESQGLFTKQIPTIYGFLITLYADYISDFDKARALCQRGLRYFPHYYMFYYYLGMLDYEDEAYEQSIENFKRALASNPAHTLSARYLAFLITLHGEEKDTINVYLDRLQENPADTNALFHLASRYQINYIYHKSIEYYEKALAYDSRFYVARSNLAYCYERLLDTRRAEEERKKIYPY